MTLPRGTLALAALAATGALLPCASTRAAPPPATFETVMQHSSAGEPVVAVDPRHAGVLLEEDSAGIKVSRDFGHHWTVVAAGQVDPAVAIDGSDLFIAHSSSGGYLPLDGFWITTSTDEGKTWGPPVQTFSYPQLAKGTVIAWDRPWLTADPTTDVVYASIAVHTEQPGTDLTDAPTLTGYLGCHATVFTNAFLPCGRRYVSASHDHGHSFEAAHPIDSADYPDTLTGGFSGIPTASHGTLATAYYSSAAPGHRCPCLVSETSRDDGATWSRHVVPGANPVVATGPATIFADKPGRAPYLSPLINDTPSVELGPYDAADPTRPGRYAVMMQDAERTALSVYETTDGGRTWHGPTLLRSGLGDSIDRPWLAFTSSGALTAFWRSDHQLEGDPYDVWVAASPSGTLTFGAPVRLSQALAPGSRNTSDDNSSVTGDAHQAYATWGDTRADGQVEPWFGSYRYR
jgi:hypothetical protein